MIHYILGIQTDIVRRMKEHESGIIANIAGKGV